MRFNKLKEKHHTYRASQNFLFLQELEKINSKFYDWMGIIVFYIALHRVRAELARKIKLIRKKIGHGRLNGYVVSHFDTSFSNDYIFLYEESRRLRYDLRTKDVFSQSDYTNVKEILLKVIFPNT